MKLSVRIFGFPLRDYASLARLSDELGFECAWIPEHLVSPIDFDTVYPYNTNGRPSFLPETPFADPWGMLCHLAAVTTRIQLGVGVFVLPLRNPFVVAKSVATAQELSNGRVNMGVGIGWAREEFETVGEKFERRGARTEEMLEVMQKLWSGQPVEHEGKWYRFRKLQMSPAISHPVPLVFGGAGELAMRRAARMGQGWYGPPCDLVAAIGYRETLHRELAAAERAVSDFQIWARAPAATEEADVRTIVGHYRDAGFEHLVVQIPRDLPDNAARLAWLTRLAKLQ